MDAVERPYVNFRFKLSIGGTEWLAFAECSGLSMETGTEDYAEGGENRFVHKLPTRGQPPNLVLKRGITHSNEPWEWYVKFLEEGVVEPRDGQVELYAGEEEAAVRAWSFKRGYPVKWTGPELNALSPGVAFETIEIVHRGVRLVE